MKLSLAVALAASGAAVVPVAASAAPHWSAPTVVIPSPGPSTTAANSVPQVGVGGGRSLLVAGSGNRALLVRGSAANVFAEPIGIADSGGAPVGTESAVGGDGTVVVGWAAGGSGHVTVVAPSGSVVGTADLPGAGINAIGVGIASDGSAVAAYRTKESAKSYSLHVVTAPAGTVSFTDAGTLETVAATDSIDVATGPSGAVAVAYRKLASKYRAAVAVRPAGASAFETPQTFGDPPAQDDQSPQVAFDADGTIVAAWGSPAGAQWASRPAGAASFGAPAPLGTGAAFSVDLESTPGGSTAVAVAGGGSVRAGVQPFGALTQVGPSFTSQFSGLAAVTTSPAGVTTVVWTNPTDGTVRAVDLGGADQVIGYGAKDTVTPVGVASSADRTVAVWTSETGGISAATRSESATPATPGSLGPKPSGRDLSGPKVKYVTGTKRFRVTTKTKTIKFKIRCSEACRYLLTGSLRTQLSGKSRRSIAPLPPVKSTKARTGVQTVTIKFGTLARRDLVKALKKRHGGQLFLVLEASDTAGNGSRTRIQLTLQPKPTKQHR